MTRHLAISAVFMALLVGTSVPVRAQSIPDGQSCGGLLCDMGVFGHKTVPSAPPAPVAPAVTAPPPKAAEAASPEPSAAELKKRITRKTKRVAKAAPVAAPVAAPSPPPQPAPQAAPSILNPYAMPQTTTYKFKPIYQ